MLVSMGVNILEVSILDIHMVSWRLLERKVWCWRQQQHEVGKNSPNAPPVIQKEILAINPSRHGGSLSKKALDAGMGTQLKVRSATARRNFSRAMTSVPRAKLSVASDMHCYFLIGDSNEASRTWSTRGSYLHLGIL
jgi:hypothetical protein